MSAAPSQLPVASVTDLLIMGDSAPGVACALSAARRGLSVAVISGRPYLGGDICADFRFWLSPKESPQTTLGRTIFGDGRTPPTPMQVKLTLEQALVKAGVDILLNAHPTGVLRDDHGDLKGVVVGSRAGRHGFVARLIVDATTDAQVCAQAGLEAWAVPKGQTRVTHVTLGVFSDKEKPATVDSMQILPGFSGTIGENEFHLEARRHELSVDLGNGTFENRLRAQAEVVDRCWARGEYLYQENLRIADSTFEHTSTGRIDPPSMEDLQLMPGLVRLGCSRALSDETNAALKNLSTAMNTGEILGQTCLAKAEPSIRLETLTVTCQGSQRVTDGRIRTLAGGLRPNTRPEFERPYCAEEVPFLGSYDVVVVGGGTGGAPAAIAAARAGAKVLLVEATSGLGGVGTMGQIASYYFGNRVGFTSEMDAGVAALEAIGPNQKPGGGWSVAAKKAWLHRECHSLGVPMAFNSCCVGTWVEKQRVRGVLVAGIHGYGLVKAGCVVDATGCADVPAAAGAKTVQLEGEHVAVQGTGLSGLNPKRSYHNSDHSFSDDTDVKDATAFIISSTLKFRDHFDMGQLVNSRERRQIIGEITLSPVDFLFGRRFSDTICVSSSNFDSHGFTIHPVFMVKPPDKTRLWVDVPFRALLPKGLEGVLVTGLGVSAHRDAVPVIRMQPDVQNQGYAAGRAAALAARNGCTPGAVDLRLLQEHLVEIGNLPERVLTDSDQSEVEDIQIARAVHDGWDDLSGLSLIFAHPERSMPKLLHAMEDTHDDAQRLRCAQVLALLGDPAGIHLVAEAVRSSSWDQGWNYKGMGQFGATLSALDGLIIALGTAGDVSVWAPLLEKMEALPEDPAFSHCRALAMASERLYVRNANGRCAPTLAALLSRPGMSGHHHTSLAAMQNALTPNINENGVRNVSLRELELARGLYRCGDHQDLARAILLNYAQDLRGHFARHARAVLKQDPEQ